MVTSGGDRSMKSVVRRQQRNTLRCKRNKRNKHRSKQGHVCQLRGACVARYNDSSRERPDAMRAQTAARTGAQTRSTQNAAHKPTQQRYPKALMTRSITHIDNQTLLCVCWRLAALTGSHTQQMSLPNAPGPSVFDGMQEFTSIADFDCGFTSIADFDCGSRRPECQPSRRR